MILIHGKEKTDGASKQKGWLQPSLLDDKWACIVLERGSFLSACIKTLWGYHNSHHCHHDYQHFHRFLSRPALINIQPVMQPDSVGGYMTSSGSEIALVNVIMLVRPSVNLTELHSLNCNFFPSRSQSIQFLSSMNGCRAVK